MWVLTEYGRLINLDRFYAVNVHEVTGHQVIARSEHADISSVVLCSCDNEEHGAEIVRHIAYALEDGVELYDIRNAKVFAYTCEVCGQRFDVPRRGGKVRSEEHTSELQSRENIVCRLLLEKKYLKLYMSLLI